MSSQLDLAQRADQLLPKMWILMTFDELLAVLKPYNAGRLLIIFSTYPNDRPLNQVVLNLLEAMPPYIDSWLEIEKKFSWLPEIKELCRRKIRSGDPDNLSFKVLHKLCMTSQEPEFKKRILNAMRTKLRRPLIPTPA